MNIFVGNNITRKATFFFKWLLRSVGRNEPLRVFGSAQHDGNDRIEAAYVINLDRQSARWKTFTREARRQRVEGRQSLLNFCHRVSAIDGKLLRPGDAASRVAASYPLDSQYYVDPDPRLLSKIREETVNVNMTQKRSPLLSLTSRHGNESLLTKSLTLWFSRTMFFLRGHSPLSSINRGRSYPRGGRTASDLTSFTCLTVKSNVGLRRFVSHRISVAPSGGTGGYLVMFSPIRRPNSCCSHFPS